MENSYWIFLVIFCINQNTDKSVMLLVTVRLQVYTYEYIIAN